MLIGSHSPILDDLAMLGADRMGAGLTLGSCFHAHSLQQIKRKQALSWAPSSSSVQALVSTLLVLVHLDLFALMVIALAVVARLTRTCACQGTPMPAARITVRRHHHRF